MALNSNGSNLCAICISPIVKGWFSESTIVHVFCYHAQDGGKRKVRKGALDKGALADPGGGCKKAHPHSSVAPLPSIFIKQYIFFDFGPVVSPKPSV